MSIGIRVGPIVSEIGAPSFFNSFFSTIQGLLEPEGAGTRFPVISGEFYDGCVSENRLIKHLLDTLFEMFECAKKRDIDVTIEEI
ncbi:hypothetical protein DIE11_17720 [Burkholderia sp. Bp9012]|uniref:Imm70 family immunity protein n=1 Tax=Burkholderia sp. Bp9012 TaxID=2184562 RepID=UPI000F5ADD2E|nr:Imm70 family immunity protein [Burkholderia sp. Bp9012]RQR79226.1 hypothetical protein DIE11_17720 [Burkholderia sp. Bp9012]